MSINEKMLCGEIRGKTSQSFLVFSAKCIRSQTVKRPIAVTISANSFKEVYKEYDKESTQVFHN